MPFLDHFLNELSRRFSEGQEIVAAAQASYMADHRYWEETFRKFIDEYADVMPCPTTIESEMKLWEMKWKSVEDEDLPNKAVTVLALTDKQLYPNICTSTSDNCNIAAYKL